MPTNFITPNRDQMLLMPPSLKDWVPKNASVHFYINVILKMNLSTKDFKINITGSGRPQYDPIMMLTLYLYCSSIGIKSSRKIESATYDIVPVRYLTGDLHPDHDTISEFRRNNKPAIEKVFMEILKLAKSFGMLQLGEISLDSTQIKANAAKQKNYTIDRAVETEKYYQGVIEEILNQSNATDDEPDPNRLPEEYDNEQKINEDIEKAQRKIAEAKRARHALEKRAQEELEKETQDFNKRINACDKKEQETGKKISRRPNPPAQEPVIQETWQANPTDPDSRLMTKQTKPGDIVQGYNAQIAIDNKSRLVLSTLVTSNGNDQGYLSDMVGRVVDSVGKPVSVAADLGYLSSEDMQAVDSQGIEVLVPVGLQLPENKHAYRNADTSIEPEPGAEVTSDQVSSQTQGTDKQSSSGHRTLTTLSGKELHVKRGRRPLKARSSRKKAIEYRDEYLRKKQEQMRDPACLARYKIRNQTSEPINSIIKHVHGLSQFLLRGRNNVQIEMDLAAGSYNLRRLFDFCQRTGVKMD